MTRTRKTNVADRIGNFFDLFGSAAAVANAVEGGRAPRARHLQTLGIEPDQFRAIGKS